MTVLKDEVVYMLANSVLYLFVEYYRGLVSTDDYKRRL